MGPRAEINIPLDAPLEQGGELVANVVPYLPPAYPTLSATVRFRGSVIGEWFFEREGPTTCSANIPADLAGDDPSASFTFEVPGARSPAQAGESMDRGLELASSPPARRLTSRAAAGSAPARRKVGSVGSS